MKISIYGIDWSEWFLNENLCESVLKIIRIKKIFLSYKLNIFEMKFKGMDNKITLSFNEVVIKKAKKYADNNNISLSRLVEFLLSKVVASNYSSLEDYPIADWVHQVAEGEGEYQTKHKRTRKAAKAEYFSSKK